MQTATRKRMPTELLSEAEKAEIWRMIRTRGERDTAAALEVSRQTLGRALGGLPIYRGTAALIRERLRALR